jgi:hypothetical protein
MIIDLCSLRYKYKNFKKSSLFRAKFTLHYTFLFATNTDMQDPLLRCRKKD